jgi:archaellum biogenesis ATPase FlaH
MFIGEKLEGIQTGIKDIDTQLVGGIRNGSLVLVEGTPDSGKSVLCRHLLYAALKRNAYAAVYYSTQDSMKEMVNDMASLGMNTRAHLLADTLRVYPLSLPVGPRQALKSGYLLTHHVRNLPERFNFIVIDSTTPYVGKLTTSQKTDFFRDCRALCKPRRIVVLVVDPYIFEKETHVQMGYFWDYHFSLELKAIRLQQEQHTEDRVVRIVYVRKIHGTEIENRPGIRFTVEPGEGIVPIPYAMFSV